MMRARAHLPPLRATAPEAPRLLGVLAGVLTCMLAAADGAGAQAHWQTVTGAEKYFSVDLPAAPEYTASDLKTGAGAPYTLHQYVVDTGDLAYVVQSTTYPAEVNLANPRANLQGGLDNAAKGLEGGRWTTIDWLSYEGQPAVSAVGVRGGKAIRSFSVLKGRNLVSLTFAGPPGSARSADAERFIGSLRLVPAP